MRKRITQLSLLSLFAIILGGCASAQQQTEVANLRFLVQEVDSLGDAFGSIFD